MKEVVIKIPDEIYEDIKNWKIHNFDFRIPLSCISEGTVLPKGHGDLIDRSNLLSKGKCCCRIEFCSGSCETCSDNCVEVIEIESAPAVIEAEKPIGVRKNDI